MKLVALGALSPGSKTNPVLPTASNRVPAMREQSAQLARQYWEDEGRRPEGQPNRHWFSAEAELQQRAGLPGRIIAGSLLLEIVDRA